MRHQIQTYSKATALMIIDRIEYLYELRFFWFHLESEKRTYSLVELQELVDAINCQYFFIKAKILIYKTNEQ